MDARDKGDEMTKADELWEKYLAPVLGDSVLRQPFKDALHEYGQAVRDRDAEIASPPYIPVQDYLSIQNHVVKREVDLTWRVHTDIAAAISKEPLP